jgi:hypothetical protein
MFYHCPWTREGSNLFVSFFIYLEQRMGAKKGNTLTPKHGLSARHIHPGNGRGLRPAPPHTIRSARNSIKVTLIPSPLSPAHRIRFFFDTRKESRPRKVYPPFKTGGHIGLPLPFGYRVLPAQRTACPAFIVGPGVRGRFACAGKVVVPPSFRGTTTVSPIPTLYSLFSTLYSPIPLYNIPINP